MIQEQKASETLKVKLSGTVEEFQKYFYGYRKEHFHAAIASYMTNGRLMLIGKHGRGKSSFARALAQIGNHTFVAYDTSKADSNIIAGFLDPRQASEGQGLPFIRHGMTIYDKEVVFFDELNRAPYQNQNAILEIMEERSLFGWALEKLKLVIAAANAGAGYQATLDMDTALFDRFSTILFIRETPLCYELVTQLMEKPRVPFQPSWRLDEDDKAAFNSVAEGLAESHHGLISEFAGDFVVEIQKILEFEFSDRTILQFRHSFYSFWAFYSILEYAGAEAICAAIQNATEFTLVNKSRSLVHDDHLPTPPRKSELEQFVLDQATELSDQIQLATERSASIEQVVNRMFMGNYIKRLMVFENNFDEIQANDVAWQSSTLALEKIISSGEAPALHRICQVELYPPEQKIKAEFELLRELFANTLFSAIATKGFADPNDFWGFLAKGNLLKKNCRDSLIRALSPCSDSVTAEQIDQFIQSVAELKKGCFRENLTGGLVLVQYHDTQLATSLPYLPYVEEQAIENLKPFLFKIDSTRQFDVFAAVPYCNGIRKGDGLINSSTGTSYFFPPFVMPAYFANCKNIELPRHLRAETTGIVANLISTVAKGATP